MDTKRIVAALPTVAFALLNLLFLFQHFTLWGCLFAFLTILFYLLRMNILRPEKFSDGPLTRTTIYLGVMFVDMLAILACEWGIILPEKQPENIVNLLLQPNLLIAAAGICLLVVFSRSNCGTLTFYLRYALMAGAAVLVSLVLFGFPAMESVLLIAAVVLAGLILDRLDKPGRHNRRCAGFVCSGILLLLFCLLHPLYGEFTSRIFMQLWFYRTQAPSPWYMYALAGVILAACAVTTGILKRSEEGGGTDVRIYLSLLSFAVMDGVLRSVSTKFDAIFMIVLAVAAIAFWTDKHEGEAWISTALFYAGTMLAAVLAPVMLYFGYIVQYACVIVALGAICGILIYGSNKSTFIILQTAITMAAVLGCLIVYFCSRVFISFVVIAAAYILATFAMVILNHENPLRKRSHHFMQTVIALFCILFMLTSANQLKIDVDFAVEDDAALLQNVVDGTASGQRQIRVSVDAENEYRAFCFWDDAEEGEEPVYIELEFGADAENLIPFRNGMLRVVCEDENGVVSTAQRWFFDHRYAEVLLSSAEG